MTAAIVYENLADAGTVDCSSFIAAAPPSTLQNVHTTRRWRGRLGDSETVTLTFSAAQSIDTVALLRCAGEFGADLRALSSAALTRVRVSSDADNPTAGDLFDAPSLAGRISDEYGALVVLLPAPVSAEAVHIDLSEVGADALLAGRLVVGLRSSFDVNFDYGWSYGFGDLSRRKKSAGGLTFVERDDRFRILNLTFAYIDTTERYGFVQDVDRINGISQDVLFVIDPSSSRPDRDSVWGLMQDLSPATQPNVAFFAKSYSIEERL